MDFMIESEQAQHRLAALTELEGHLSFRIARLSKLMDNLTSQQLSQTGLNLTWYRILMVLGIFGETTAADLSRLMVVDRAQISRATADLVDEGFVHSRPDPKNRRKKLLRLSEKAQTLMAKTQPMVEVRQGLIFAILTDEERNGLVAAIDKLSRHLAAELENSVASPPSVIATP